MVVIAEAEKTKDHRVDWKTVRGLMVDAIYGGRVDNPHDMRVLATYLRLYFNPDVVSTDILYRPWHQYRDRLVFLFMSIRSLYLRPKVVCFIFAWVAMIFVCVSSSRLTVGVATCGEGASNCAGTYQVAWCMASLAFFLAAFRYTLDHG